MTANMAVNLAPIDAGIYMSVVTLVPRPSVQYTHLSGVGEQVSGMFYNSLLHSKIFKATTEGCSHTLASYPARVRLPARSSVVRKNGLVNQVKFHGLAHALVTV